MINSRLITDLLPEVQLLCLEFERRVRAAGFDHMITSTYRDQECQDWTYAKGRTRPGKIVTWVKESVHTDRRAWDVALLKPGTHIPEWDIKVDVDKDSIPDYLEIAKIGKEMGLRCGADFGDYTHFEIPEERIGG